MIQITRLEELANRFIDTSLRDRPISIDSLDAELVEYVESVPELMNDHPLNNILQEYSKSERKKVIDEEINNELINAADKFSNPSGKEIDKDFPDSSLLVHIQSSDDPLIYELMQLVVRNSKVRIREMVELAEFGQEDPCSPNK